MVDDVKLKVNPPTCQKGDSGPELKLQGAENVAGAFTATNAVKLPSRLSTVGMFPVWSSHPVTAVAVPADAVLS